MQNVHTVYNKTILVDKLQQIEDFMKSLFTTYHCHTQLSYRQ